MRSVHLDFPERKVLSYVYYIRLCARYEAKVLKGTAKWSITVQLCPTALTRGVWNTHLESRMEMSVKILSLDVAELLVLIVLPIVMFVNLRHVRRAVAGSSPRAVSRELAWAVMSGVIVSILLIMEAAMWHVQSVSLICLTLIVVVAALAVARTLRMVGMNAEALSYLREQPMLPPRRSAVLVEQVAKYHRHI